MAQVDMAEKKGILGDTALMDMSFPLMKDMVDMAGATKDMVLSFHIILDIAMIDTLMVVMEVMVDMHIMNLAMAMRDTAMEVMVDMHYIPLAMTMRDTTMVVMQVLVDMITDIPIMILGMDTLVVMATEELMKIYTAQEVEMNSSTNTDGFKL